MEPHAGLDRFLAQGAYVLARMQHPASLLQVAAGDPAGEVALGQLGRVEHPHRSAELARRSGSLLQPGALARVDAGQHVAGRHVVAVDPVVGDRRLDVLDGGLREADQGAPALAAVNAKQRRKVLADRRRQVAGVAPACAEARVVALEHHHVGAALSQRERRPQPRVAGADHDHVGLHGPLQRRPRVRRRVEPKARGACRGRSAVHGAHTTAPRVSSRTPIVVAGSGVRLAGGVGLAR
jgi:hypothetical protein